MEAKNKKKLETKKSTEKIVEKAEVNFDSSVLEEKLRNLTFIVIIGFVVMLLLLIGLYFKNPKVESTSGNADSAGSSSDPSESSYLESVSNMHKVSVDEALALFDDGKAHVLYIGRAGCGACQAFVPNLRKVQDDMNITVDYLDLNELMVKYSNNWTQIQAELKPLTDKLTYKVTERNMQDEEEENTIGYFFYNIGYTPTLAIIKDGKNVDGFIGAYDETSIKNTFSKYF